MDVDYLSRLQSLKEERFILLFFRPFSKNYSLVSLTTIICVLPLTSLILKAAFEDSKDMAARELKLYTASTLAVVSVVGITKSKKLRKSWMNP